MLNKINQDNKAPIIECCKKLRPNKLAIPYINIRLPKSFNLSIAYLLPLIILNNWKR